MRRRLLLALLAFSAVAVTAFAWPLLISTASERTQRLVNSRTGDLERFVATARQDAVDKDNADIRAEVGDYHELHGDGVIVVSARGVPIAEAGISASDPEIATAIAGALRNQQAASVDDLRPWSDEDVLLAGPISTDTQVIGAVVLRSSVRNAAMDIATQWTWILVTALAAAGICVLLALQLARWVLRPLAELERGVLAVADGQGDTHIGEHLGPRELRVLAGSFNRMAHVVNQSAQRQRQLIADASHELRSPIARLRLTVDALASQIQPDDGESYRRIVAEVGELETLSGSLLELARADQTATEVATGTCASDSCDATELLVERAEAWLPKASSAKVELEGPDAELAVWLACRESELKRVLDVALDNAIKYAGPHAHVTLACTATSDWGRVAVTDDGPGLSPQELAEATTRFWRSPRHRAESGSGLGLAIAERLVTARGGTLTVRANQPRGLAVEIALPLAEELTE